MTVSQGESHIYRLPNYLCRVPTEDFNESESALSAILAASGVMHRGRDAPHSRRPVRRVPGSTATRSAAYRLEGWGFESLGPRKVNGRLINRLLPSVHCGISISSLRP
jgi:hypothetical protein